MATNPITSDSLTLDFKQLMRIPVGTRVQAASLSGSFLQSLINSLTPIQIAKAFPDYYRRSLPDISNFINASRYFDAGGQAHQTGGGEGGSAYPYYDEGNNVNGSATPVGQSRLTIEEMKKKLLENGINVDNTYDLISQGPILQGDERIPFLKNMTSEELLKAGLQRVEDENGKTLIQMIPSQYEGMTDEQILEKYKKEFPSTNFTPRERATLDLIAKREGSKDPNIIFGDVGGEAGTGKYSQQLRAMGYTKPLTEMTISEVRALQKDLIKITKGKIGKGDLGTSAVGTGQMIGSTLEDNLRFLNIPEDQWDEIKFDKNLQERLTLANFENSGIGNPNADPSTWNHKTLGSQYESFDTSKFPPMTQQEADSVRDKSTVRPQQTENITPQEALTKLKEVERKGYQDEFTRMIFDRPSPTSSDYIQAPFDKRDVTVLHGQTDTFMARSNRGVLAAGIENIDPRLVTLGDAAIRSFEMMNPGYTVRVISGKRTEATNSGSPTSRHLRGGAVDYEIVDPDGNVLPNLGGGNSGVRAEAGFYAPKYEEFGRYMEAARLNLAKDDPRYAENQVVAGLHFGGNWWMDSMHMQLGGKGALGDLYSGFKSPEQLRKEGQPEVIVQAVENAIKAGAVNSVNEEEMQQLSEFLYNGGTAPIEVVQKVNPIVAEKLQKELEQKEIETAKKLEEQKAAQAEAVPTAKETSDTAVTPAPSADTTINQNITQTESLTVIEQRMREAEARKIEDQKTAAAPAPANTPVRQFALGGNMYGLNEDMTLVETETGKPIAQIGQNEKIEKQGNAIQVTPETKLKADELTEKYDASSEVETRMNDIEDKIEQQQETASQSARKPIAPERVDNAPLDKWREAVASAERPVSPSFNRAVARTKFFPEGHHYQRGAVSSKST